MGGSGHQRDQGNEYNIDRVHRRAHGDQYGFSSGKTLQDIGRQQLHQVAREGQHRNYANKGIVRLHQQQQTGQEVAADQVGDDVCHRVVFQQRAAGGIALLIPLHKPAIMDDLPEAMKHPL